MTYSPPTRSPALSADANPRRLAILVVDDQFAMRRLLEASLGRQHEVVAVDNPLKAIELLEARCFDVIISDYNMPELSGVELLRQVSGRWPGIGRILMSGTHKSEIEMFRIDPAVEEFLEKPFYLEKVYAALERVALRLSPTKSPSVPAQMTL